MNEQTAVIIGASGLIGNHLVEQMLPDEYFSTVRVLVRRSLPVNHPKLQQAIVSLPEKQRLVFNMRYYDEIKYEKMSEILGTSVGALKASYHHAVQKIEKFIVGD